MYGILISCTGKSFVKYIKTWSVLKTMGNTWRISVLFVYNQGVKELITHCRDSIHNCEYNNFYYRDSIIFTIAQPYFTLMNTLNGFIATMLNYQTINLFTWKENLDSTLKHSYPFVAQSIGYTWSVMVLQFENVIWFLHQRRFFRG